MRHKTQKRQPVKKQVAFTPEHMNQYPKRYQVYRKDFYDCYRHTAENQIVNFRGTVTKLDYKKGVLLQNITVTYHDTDGVLKQGTEEHVWIRTMKPFLRTGIRVQQDITFQGRLKPYCKYGQLDLSIWSVHNIHHIQDAQNIS